MNILVVSKSFPPMHSAQSIQSRKLVDILAKSNSVFVLTTTCEGDGDFCEQKYAGNNVRIIRTEDKKKGETKNRYFRKISRIRKEIKQVMKNSEWVNKSVSEALNLCKTLDVNAVITISTPFDCHWVGAAISEAMNIRWIAYFSDPFPISLAPSPYSTANYVPFLWPFQLRALKTVLHRVDQLVFSSEYAWDVLPEELTAGLYHKVNIIPHIGVEFSHADVKGGKQLVHIGNLTKERSSVQFLEAIKQVKKQNPDFKGLKCIGRVSEKFIQEATRIGADKLLVVDPPVPEFEAIAVARCSPVLVVIEADMPFSPFLPSKFADYASSLRPILAITPNRSAITDYLKLSQCGKAVPHDTNAIADAIEILLFTESEDKQIQRYKGLANIFSPQSVAIKYQNIFENLKCI